MPDVGAGRAEGRRRHALITEGDRIALAAGSALRSMSQPSRALAASKEVQDLDAAQALYRGEFLSGLAIASEPFPNGCWSSGAGWLRRCRMFSIGSPTAARSAGEAEQAIPVAERLVAFDALREDGHRLLMQLLSQAGRRDAALKQYARCVELLRRDLGVAPEPATTALADAIRGGHTAAEPASAPAAVPATPMLALPDKPSIALLPFSNLSGSADQDYFADGIADDLTIALGRIPWLFVIASSSTSRYRADAPDVRQIGPNSAFAMCCAAACGAAASACASSCNSPMPRMDGTSGPTASKARSMTCSRSRIR